MADPAVTTVVQTKEIEISIDPASSSGEYTEALEQLGLRLEDDGYVKWRTDCVAHPRNWGGSRKAFDTGLILMLDLFTYLPSPRLLINLLIRLRTERQLALQACVKHLDWISLSELSFGFG